MSQPLIYSAFDSYEIGDDYKVIGYRSTGPYAVTGRVLGTRLGSPGLIVEPFYDMGYQVVQQRIPSAQ